MASHTEDTSLIRATSGCSQSRFTSQCASKKTSTGERAIDAPNIRDFIRPANCIFRNVGYKKIYSICFCWWCKKRSSVSDLVDISTFTFRVSINDDFIDCSQLSCNRGWNKEIGGILFLSPKAKICPEMQNITFLRKIVNDDNLVDELRRRAIENREQCSHQCRTRLIVICDDNWTFGHRTRVPHNWGTSATKEKMFQNAHLVVVFLS